VKIVDLVSQLLQTIASHLRELDFDVRAVPEGQGSELDLVVAHPAVRGDLGVVLVRTPGRSLDLPTTRRVLLGAPRLSDGVRTLAHSAGAVGCIDASGNAAIRVDDLYVDIRGRKPSAVAQAARQAESRGWSTRPTGLQVLFALLTVPGLLGTRLMDIADHAGVSIATTHRVMSDLGQQGFIVESPRGRIWLNRPGATRAWVEGYTRTVAPRIKESSFVTDVPAMGWREVGSKVDSPLWVTGGAALTELGADLVPVTATIYHAGPLTPTRSLRLRRPRGEEAGDLFIRQPWWPPGAYPPGIAPELLVYADAISSGDPRIASAATQVVSDVADLSAAVE